MVAFLSIITLGFFLGMWHATNPDHVIAVTTIVTRERKLSRSAWVGVFWGIGHTLTIFMVGVAIILFGLVIPPRIGLSMELAVGLMLIVLGLMNVKSFLRAIPDASDAALAHSHAHSHGDYIHSHPHGHAPECHPHAAEQTPLAKLDGMMLKFRAYRPARPLIIGFVHGLAGSAYVALLVLTTIRDSRWAIAYLLVFGVGTIAGMMLITMSIATSFHLVRGGATFFRRLALASGLLSLGFGLVVAYRILTVYGLFTVHPQWTPR